MSSPHNRRRRGYRAFYTSVPRRPISSRSDPRSSSYLDLLPREALENVLRHVSKKPRLLNWKSFISTRDIFALYRVGGSLTATCKELFKEASLGESCPNNGTLVIPRENDFCILLDIAGSSFEKLTFAKLPGHMSFGHIERTLASKCNAVKSLHLLDGHGHDLFDKVLEKCSGTLEFLSTTLTYQKNVTAMVQHCSGLRALDLGHLSPDAVISSLWPTVGKSLRCLRLSYIVRCEDEDIRCIQTHCRALQLVEISGIGTPEALGDLFVSYGCQLEHVSLNDASPEICRRVVNACPNLSCHAVVSHDVPAVVEALGPALKELRFRRRPGICIDGLNDAMKHCANLKQLSVFGPSEATHQIVSGIFSSPMAQLEVLDLGPGLRKDCEKILDCVSRNTGGLREFTLGIMLPQPKLFCGIVQSNALLETVKIHLSVALAIKSGAGVSAVVDILESFSSCPNLRYLQLGRNHAITNSRDVINACRPFRFKRTFVRVFGEDLFL